MDWVFENLNVIIIIGGAVAYWLNQRRREKEGLPADYDEDGTPENRPTRTDFDPGTMEAEEAQRTRQLQEELRRKREQRAGGAGVPAAPLHPSDSVPPLPLPSRREMAPPPVHHDPMAELMKELAKKLAPQTVPVQPPAHTRTALDAEDDAVLERQRALEERYKALQAQKKALQKQRSELAERSAASETSVSHEANAPVGSWLADLRNPAEVRRAIVMNEILGKPVALRT